MLHGGSGDDEPMKPGSMFPGAIFSASVYQRSAGVCNWLQLFDVSPVGFRLRWIRRIK